MMYVLDPLRYPVKLWLANCTIVALPQGAARPLSQVIVVLPSAVENEPACPLARSLASRAVNWNPKRRAAASVMRIVTRCFTPGV